MRGEWVVRFVSFQFRMEFIEAIMNVCACVGVLWILWMWMRMVDDTMLCGVVNETE